MNVFKFFLLVGIFSNCYLGYISWTKRKAPGAWELLLLQMSQAWWLLWYVIPLPGISAADAVFLRFQLIYPGVVLIAPATLLFVLRYTGYIERVPLKWLALLSIEPVLVLIAVFVPAFHDEFYGAWRARPGDGNFRGGPFFWLHAMYSYATVAIACGFLVRRYHSFAASYRRQVPYLLIAIFVPILCNIFTVLGNIRANVDLTPFGFVISGAIFSWVLLSRGLLDLVKFAHEKIADVISDGILVIDNRRRVVESNPAVWRILELDGAVQPGQILGGEFADLLPSALLSTSNTAVVDFPRGDKHLEVRIFALNDRDGVVNGHVMLLRDITEAKKTAAALELTNQQLRDQVARVELMQNQLLEQVVRDPLTKLYNRRYLEEALKRELGQTSRNGGSFAVVMIDIDHFKSVNDNYGHACGDAVLQALGNILLQQTRSVDAACRYGGEEFVVIMHATTSHAASTRVEAWRKEFSELEFLFGRETVSRTFSAGVAMYPDHGEDAAALMAAADQALYVAKAQGRNRVQHALAGK